MKLRVRLSGRTEKVDTGENASLGRLNELVAATFGLSDDSFILTLNGRDELTGTADKSLTDFDLVSGDLIRVVLRAGAVAPVHHPPKQQQQQCQQQQQQQQRRHQQEPQPGPSNVSSQPPVADIKTKGDKEKCTEENDGKQMEAESMGTDDKTVYVTEPMLCRDATALSVPYRLHRLYTDTAPRNVNEALCIVLHILMIETGFYSKDSECNEQKSTDVVMETEDDENITESTEVDSSFKMPEDWRKPSCYKLTYIHPACEGAVCTVTCVPMGSLLMVHGSIAGSKGSQCQLKLKSTEYVTSPLNQNVVESYRQLSVLSRIFKDNISYPLLAAMRTELGLPPLHGLLALVTEIQLKILSLLDVKSLVAMASVCKDLSTLSRDASLWRRLYLRDFGESNQQQVNWKSMYITKYRQRREANRRQYVPTPPMLPNPLFNVPPQFHPPLPPMAPPGFRGGDYDRDPFAAIGPGHPLNPLQPPGFPRLPGPRFDPFNPLPDQPFAPGRGGGVSDSRGRGNIPDIRKPFGWGGGGYGGGGFM